MTRRRIYLIGLCALAMAAMPSCIAADAALKGDVLLSRSQFTAAIDAYQSQEPMLKSNPQALRRLLTNLAYAQITVGRDEDADKTLDRLKLDDKETASPEFKRLKSALEQYKKSGSLIDRATRFLEQKKFDDAIGSYKLATVNMPYNAEFHLLLAYAYRAKYVGTKRSADWSNAKAEFEQVKRLDPQEFQEICKDAVKPKI
jgi:tetratricopeptide (TPR) repeat protein